MKRGFLAGAIVFALALGHSSVRAGGSGPFIDNTNQFVENGDDTVTDTKTGLMWAARDNGSDIDADGAKRYCEKYRGGGYADWRLPTVKEARSLYDAKFTRYAPCDDDPRNPLHLTTRIHVTCHSVWASKTQGSPDVQLFYFDSGLEMPFHYARQYHRVLPVRSQAKK